MGRALRSSPLRQLCQEPQQLQPCTVRGSASLSSATPGNPGSCAAQSQAGPALQHMALLTMLHASRQPSAGQPIAVLFQPGDDVCQARPVLGHRRQLAPLSPGTGYRLHPCHSCCTQHMCLSPGLLPMAAASRLMGWPAVGLHHMQQLHRTSPAGRAGMSRRRCLFSLMKLIAWHVGVRSGWCLSSAPSALQLQGHAACDIGDSQSAVLQQALLGQVQPPSTE